MTYSDSCLKIWTYLSFDYVIASRGDMKWGEGVDAAAPSSTIMGYLVLNPDNTFALVIFSEFLYLAHAKKA